MDAHACPVIVNPIAQPRPDKQERFVGDLHIIGFGGDQALVDENVEDRLRITMAEQ